MGPKIRDFCGSDGRPRWQGGDEGRYRGRWEDQPKGEDRRGDGGEVIEVELIERHMEHHLREDCLGRAKSHGHGE